MTTNPRPFPMADHPLTLAYITSVRAKTHDSMREAARLARLLESRENGQTIQQCKLAAEVLIERNR